MARYSSDRLYYTADANMNVTAMLSSSGQPVERYVYPPYGEASVFDALLTSLRPPRFSATSFSTLAATWTLKPASITTAPATIAELVGSSAEILSVMMRVMSVCTDTSVTFPSHGGTHLGFLFS